MQTQMRSIKINCVVEVAATIIFEQPVYGYLFIFLVQHENKRVRVSVKSCGGIIIIGDYPLVYGLEWAQKLSFNPNSRQ